MTADLGRDPVACLTELGATDSRVALSARRGASSWLTEQQHLRLLRFGLGHPDQQVVLGTATLFCGQYSPPVPELAHAASVVLPMLGTEQCSVSWYDARPLIGAVDFDGLIDVILRLPEPAAIRFLGELHRVTRQDTVAAMCELAHRAVGHVRAKAFGNAAMTDGYDGRIRHDLVRNWLELQNREPARDQPGRLPGLLRTALQSWAEQCRTRASDPDQVPDAHPLGLPPTVRRWFAASVPGPADLPLLRELLATADFELATTTAWTLGAMTDSDSRALLDSEPSDHVADRIWLAAKARRGDATALEQLFRENEDDVAFALTLASPSRRRQYFRELLALPVPAALARIRHLGAWPRRDLWSSFLMPAYDDRYLAELNPAIRARAQIDTTVLRACIAWLPCCETRHLADLLLARPAAELFDEPHDDARASPFLGHGGVWAFLEVTRPAAFRRRLQEGLFGNDPDICAACARLLIQLGSSDHVDRLGAWIDEHGSADDWLALARERDPRVMAAITERLQEMPTDPRDHRHLLTALAVCEGMPFRVALSWNPTTDRIAAVRSALLRNEPANAFIDTQPELHVLQEALCWQDPRVRQYAARVRRLSQADPDSLYEFDQFNVLFHGTPAEIERALQPIRDGRYATHLGTWSRIAARAGGLEMLPFWIDELGTNCCRVAIVESALAELFGHDSGAFEDAKRLEPAAAYLRRTLLPVRHRLRWSRIANGYVVAGH
ncbi:MAG: hypothetical protein NXI31_10365 [bacterium]|nr:hypothetical protein [bacterium]